jgi:hypothetical protein
VAFPPPPVTLPATRLNVFRPERLASIWLITSKGLVVRFYPSNSEIFRSPSKPFGFDSKRPEIADVRSLPSLKRCVTASVPLLGVGQNARKHQASDKASLKFSRAEGGAPDSTKGVLLFQIDSPLSSQRPPGQQFVKKKRELSPGPRPDVFEFSCVATQYPPPACRILTTFPFGLDNVVAGLPLTSGPSHS